MGQEMWARTRNYWTDDAKRRWILCIVSGETDARRVPIGARNDEASCHLRVQMFAKRVREIVVDDDNVATATGQRPAARSFDCRSDIRTVKRHPRTIRFFPITFISSDQLRVLVLFEKINVSGNLSLLHYFRFVSFYNKILFKNISLCEVCILHFANIYHEHACILIGKSEESIVYVNGRIDGARYDKGCTRNPSSLYSCNLFGACFFAAKHIVRKFQKTAVHNNRRARSGKCEKRVG